MPRKMDVSFELRWWMGTYIGQVLDLEDCGSRGLTALLLSRLGARGVLSDVEAPLELMTRDGCSLPTSTAEDGTRW